MGSLLSFLASSSTLTSQNFQHLALSKDTQLLPGFHHCHGISANINPRYLISLTLGVKSNQPCPICCVPQDCLESIDTKFPLRSSSECKQAVTSALQAKTAAEGDRICHSLGVCKIKVLCYWLFPMSLLTWL